MYGSCHAGPLPCRPAMVGVTQCGNDIAVSFRACMSTPAMTRSVTHAGTGSMAPHRPWLSAAHRTPLASHGAAHVGDRPHTSPKTRQAHASPLCIPATTRNHPPTKGTTRWNKGFVDSHDPSTWWPGLQRRTTANTRSHPAQTLAMHRHTETKRQRVPSPRAEEPPAHANRLQTSLTKSAWAGDEGDSTMVPSGASPRRLRASCSRDSASSAVTPQVRASRLAAITPERPVPPEQWMYSLSPAAMPADSALGSCVRHLSSAYRVGLLLK